MYDFDGVDDYISCNIPLVVDDVVSFKFIAPLGGYSVLTDGYIISQNSGNFPRIFVTTAGLISFKGFDSGTLDGSAISTGDALPTDGAEHTVTARVPGSMLIGFVGGYGGKFCDFPIYDLIVNDGSVYNYPINDGWANNPVIANTGSSADATAINFNEERWIGTAPSEAVIGKGNNINIIVKSRNVNTGN